jgi:hypothetical protein
MFKQLDTRAIIPIAVSALLLISATVAFSADSRVRTVTQLSVVDARGRFVGTVLDPSSTPTIVVRAGSIPVILTVLPNEFASGGNTTYSIIQYTGDDCTGETLAGGGLDPANPLFPLILLNGQRLWQHTGPTQEGLIYRSYREVDGTTCVQVGPTPDNASPVVELGDLRSEFQPPYRLSFGDRN